MPKNAGKNDHFSSRGFLAHTSGTLSVSPFCHFFASFSPPPFFFFGRVTCQEEVPGNIATTNPDNPAEINPLLRVYVFAAAWRYTHVGLGFEELARALLAGS